MDRIAVVSIYGATLFIALGSLLAFSFPGLSLLMSYSTFLLAPKYTAVFFFEAALFASLFFYPLTFLLFVPPWVAFFCRDFFLSCYTPRSWHGVLLYSRTRRRGRRGGRSSASCLAAAGPRGLQDQGGRVAQGESVKTKRTKQCPVEPKRSNPLRPCKWVQACCHDQKKGKKHTRG